MLYLDLPIVTESHDSNTLMFGASRSSDFGFLLSVSKYGRICSETKPYLHAGRAFNVYDVTTSCMPQHTSRY